MSFVVGVERIAGPAFDEEEEDDATRLDVPAGASESMFEVGATGLPFSDRFKGFESNVGTAAFEEEDEEKERGPAGGRRDADAGDAVPVALPLPLPPASPVPAPVAASSGGMSSSEFIKF